MILFFSLKKHVSSSLIGDESTSSAVRNSFSLFLSSLVSLMSVNFIAFRIALLILSFYSMMVFFSSLRSLLTISERLQTTWETTGPCTYTLVRIKWLIVGLTSMLFLRCWGTFMRSRLFCCLSCPKSILCSVGRLRFAALFCAFRWSLLSRCGTSTLIAGRLIRPFKLPFIDDRFGLCDLLGVGNVEVS